MSNKYMGGLEQAIFDRMENDTDLTEHLETYKGRPAIFTTRPAPEDVSGPYILADGYISASSSNAARSKQKRARQPIKDISVYSEFGDALRKTSTSDMELAAERVYELFDRHVFDEANLDGHKSVLTRAAGPSQAPPEKDAVGLIVQIDALIHES